MTGTMIEFKGNGQPYTGYLSPSAEGKGRGVIVIQEWWGLVGHIKDVADRFAKEGFTALAPDFYHGKHTDEPDEAGSLMMALEVPDAERVIQGAVDALLANPATTGGKVGVVGFCMGGQLSLYAASINPKIGACVDYYGIHPNVHPDLKSLQAPVLGFFAERDEHVWVSQVSALDMNLSELGKEHYFKTYEGCQHAFFNSDRPEVYNQDAAEDSWAVMLKFFRRNLR
ncbi:MAG: dienelactone hydrolase family protein [Armatimonadetes bacterium]|nr:dienelactone hydrolase family protein [Armatimonadota bacterium]